MNVNFKLYPVNLKFMKILKLFCVGRQKLRSDSNGHNEELETHSQ